MNETESEAKDVPAKHPERIIFKDALPHHVVAILGKVGGGRLGYFARLSDFETKDGEVYSRYTYDNRIDKAVIFAEMPTQEVKARVAEICQQFAVPVRIHYRTLASLAATKTPKPKFKR